jgi:beta-glucanase (GH16 family)
MGAGAATANGGSSDGGSSSPADGGAGATPEGGSSNPDTDIGNGWELVWSDEFDAADIDANNWEHEVNCWGGGNNEEQCYVADAKNSFTDDGALHIVALADSPNAAIGGPENDPTLVTRPYSSARLTSRGKADFKYGRIEARLLLPPGQGLWPAFWMLPTDGVYGGWAASGEIDIMEAVNLAPGNNIIYGTLHYGGAWPANVHTGSEITPAANVWESSHVYAVEWQEGEVRWFVDDTHYETQVDWNSTEAPFPAPFDQEFHILLNVAVGGAWPGPPNGETTFPQEMVVDYVRVYQCAADPDTGVGCGTSDPDVEPL